MIKLTDLINEATTMDYRFKNEPNPIIDKSKEWIKNNPELARRKPEESDYFKIEVFGYNHKEQAQELYNVLKSSGYLENHPLYRIRIEPMQ